MSVNDQPYKNTTITSDVIEFKNFGNAEELEVTQCVVNELLPHQLLIRNYATSVNPIDFKTRQGLGWAAAQNADKLPMVLGYDVAGEVIAKGTDVSEFSVGDNVLGFVGFPLTAGAYAQHVIAIADELTKVSDHNNAYSALPLAGLTAYQGLFDIGKLKAGETVLISGASGGVGYIAAQLALNIGANVIALASKKNHEKLKALGSMTLIDYTDADAFEALPNIDLWFDLVGGNNAIEQLTAAPKVERLVTVPTITKDEICNVLSTKILSIEGMLVAKNQEQLSFLAKAVENGDLRLNIAKYVDYKNAIEAHNFAESGDLNGKIIITLD